MIGDKVRKEIADAVFEFARQEYTGRGNQKRLINDIQRPYPPCTYKDYHPNLFLSKIRTFGKNHEI